MSDRSPRPPGQPKPSKASTDSHPRRSSQANAKRGGTPSTKIRDTSSEPKEVAGEEDVFANTQRVRTGDKTLLLCMDIDESGAKPQPKDKTIEISIPDVLLAAGGGSFDVSSIVGMELSLGFLSQSEDSMDKAMAGVSPDASKPVAEEPMKPISIPSALPNVPIKRRMSRAEQFSALEKTIPNVKLDRQMRKTVVHTMVEMNIWKEDEEDDDDLSLTESSPAKGRKSMANKSTKVNESPRKKSTMISPATAATLSPNRKSSVKPVPPPAAKDIGPAAAAASSTSPSPVVINTATHSSTHPTTATAVSIATVTASQPTAATITSPTRKEAAATTSTLTAPTASAGAAARGKVPMHRPSQIPVNEQAQKRDDRQRVERESVREAIVNKAVQFLVDLNHKQDLELQQQQQQQPTQQHGSPTSMGALAYKSPKEIKMIAVKKLTASLVDRALKKGRNFFHKEVEKHRIEEWKYFRRRAQAARFLSKAWRRHCSRHDVQKILAMGRASIEAKKVAEIEEQYEYRIRMAQRRVWEQSLHKAWMKGQKEYPTFPVTKHVTERELGPIRLNDDGLAMSSADEQLFAEDFNHLRPDLAPFSTKINAMISSSLQEVKRHVDRKQLLERSMELFAGEGTQKSATRSRVSSMSGEESRDPATSSALSSPRATSTPLRSPRTPKTPNGTTMSASSRAFDFPPSALTLPFPTSIPTVAQTPRAALHKMRAEDAGHEVMVQLSLPQRVLDRSDNSLKRSSNLAGWEEMARLDNLPSVEEIKKNAAIKSSAYKVLERLSGLTEEDIMRSKLERLKEGAEQVSLANSKFLFL